MELDQLKSIWKESDAAVSNTSAEELDKMLRMQSKSPIAKMKRNLFWEMISVVITYSLSLYFLSTQSSPGFVVLLVLVALMYVVYYYYKRKLLSNMECVSCEVKSNLQMQLVTLEKFVRAYFIAGTLATPIAFLLGLYIGLEKGGLHRSWTGTTIPALLIYAGLAILITVVMYFINKGYVYKLYGQHIEKLKNIVNEMEDISSNA